MNEEQAESAVDQMMGAMASSGTGSSGAKSNQLKMSSETVGSLLGEKMDQVAQLQAHFDSLKLEAENSPAQQHSRHVSLN